MGGGFLCRTIPSLFLWTADPGITSDLSLDDREGTGRELVTTYGLNWVSLASVALRVAPVTPSILSSPSTRDRDGTGTRT